VGNIFLAGPRYGVVCDGGHTLCREETMVVLHVSPETTYSSGTDVMQAVYLEKLDRWWSEAERGVRTEVSLGQWTDWDRKVVDGRPWTRRREVRS
jgi:hypothetical protein